MAALIEQCEMVRVMQGSVLFVWPNGRTLAMYLYDKITCEVDGVERSGDRP